MLVVGGESHLYLLASGGNLAEAAADTQPEKKKNSLPEKANSLPCLPWMSNFITSRDFIKIPGVTKQPVWESCKMAGTGGRG